MPKIRLAPGVWTNAAGMVLGGAGAMTGATASQTWLQVVGWLGMALGLGILIWGITIDGQHWWRRPKAKSTRKGILTISLDDAIRYLADESAWGESQDRTNVNFLIALSAMLTDALANGDIESRGRFYDELRGGIRNPPLHSRLPIPKEFWKPGMINPWWAMNPEANIEGIWVPSRVQKNDLEGMHDIKLDRDRLEALWPRKTK